MAGAMKPAVAALALMVLGASSAIASLLPEDWESTQLPNAGGTNQWFFFPDAEKKPRIIAKAIANTAAVNRATLSGGPNLWTAAPSVSEGGLNKYGVFVPTGDESGFLVGEHLAGGQYRLRMWSFANGTVGDSVVDDVPNAAGMNGVSAALDPAGNLHAAWVWNPGANESLVYGRRNSAGVWQIDEQIFNRPAGGGADNGIRLGVTAVVPSAFGAANIYFTMNSPITQPVPGTVTSLMRMNLLINAGGMFLDNPQPLVTAGVRHTLRGTRVGAVDRLYFFEGNVLRRWNGAGTTDVQAAVAGAVPRSIHVGISPVDGRQRIAWYDSNSKKIHYLRPNSADVTYTAFNPVTIPGGGALADADLQGLHFDANGLPHILYRRAAAEGYVAFPNDEFDTNANGRPEIVDEALTLPQGAVEVLPVPAAVAGVANSANRFKIRFATQGSTAAVGPKLESASKNLRYEVEVSTNQVTWNKLTELGSITFTQTAATGNNPNQVRTFVGVLPEVAPGALRIRFARLIVTRTNYSY